MTTTHYYKMLSGPVKKAERKPIQAYTNFQEKPAAGDQLRALQVIKLLCEKPRTLHELSIILNVHTRTVRRYCALIVDLGCPLEADEQNRYQIENCPFCKKTI